MNKQLAFKRISLLLGVLIVLFFVTMTVIPNAIKNIRKPSGNWCRTAATMYDDFQLKYKKMITNKEEQELALIYRDAANFTVISIKNWNCPNTREFLK